MKVEFYSYCWSELSATLVWLSVHSMVDLSCLVYWEPDQNANICSIWFTECYTAIRNREMQIIISVLLIIIAIMQQRRFTGIEEQLYEIAIKG